MKQNKRIFSICYYDVVAGDTNRKIALSSVNKLNYIFSALKFVLGKKISIGQGNTLRLFSSFGGIKRLTAISKIWTLFQMFIYLLFYVKKDSQVLVYHSPAYTNILLWIKRIKRCELVGEIEEIYQNVSKMTKRQCNLELKFINACDKYIFPTILLDKYVNKQGKPSAIIHGTYSVPDKQEKKIFVDDKIHVVYAGTLNILKGGAAAAISSALYLSDQYHIHILGAGSDEEIHNINNLISKVTRTGYAKVTYEGLLSGEEFDRFLQSCHIGLSTQDPSAAFNSTSYPSKILTYMGNGLTVVSVRIPAIELSSVSSDLSYYDVQTPENIADAIINVDFSDSFERNRLKIKSLDQEFMEELKKLLS